MAARRMLPVPVHWLSCILQKDGSAILPVKHSATDVFEAPSDNRGYHNFVTKSWLKNSLCLDKDCLTIRCVLTIIKGSHIEDVDMNSVDGQVWSMSKIARPILAPFWHYHSLVTEFVARGLTMFRRAGEPGSQIGGYFAKVMASDKTDARFGQILANQKLANLKMTSLGGFCSSILKTC
jgi:hypothetical protein